jgi:RNA polymerase sigma-70 factor (ECF subfamily)
VTTIAVRVALTELRRRRWKDVSLDALPVGKVPRPAVELDRSASPEREAQQRQIVGALQRLIEDELTDRQRIAILAELAGMPQEEIGRRLGITRNAVYKLGHDARKKLKRGLENAGFDAEAIRTSFAGGGG